MTPVKRSLICMNMKYVVGLKYARLRKERLL